MFNNIIGGKEMKKFFYLLALVFIFTSCNDPKPHSREVIDDEFRFQVVYSQYLGYSSGYALIIIDKETGVKYLLVKKGEAAGLVKLEEVKDECVVHDPDCKCHKVDDTVSESNKNNNNDNKLFDW